MKVKTKSRLKKIIINILVLAVTFGAGMGFGAYLNEKYSNEIKAVFSNQVVEIKDEKEAQAPSASPKPTLKHTKEESELCELGGEFVSIMEEKYPEVEVSFLIENLDTGAQCVHNAKKMNCASIIKLFVMEHVYKGVQAGEYELTEKIEEDMYHMLAESDNPSVNRFIDLAGGENEKRKVDETNGINKTIKEQKYKDTELNRKMHDEMPPEGPTGYQNYSSVTDVAQLLRSLHNGELLEEKYNKKAVNILENQKKTWKIPFLIAEEYPEITVANKTGELAQVENDAAIITGDGLNLMFIIMTDNIPLDDDGSPNEEAKANVQYSIAEMSLKIVEFYKENKF